MGLIGKKAPKWKTTGAPSFYTGAALLNGTIEIMLQLFIGLFSVKIHENRGCRCDNRRHCRDDTDDKAQFTSFFHFDTSINSSGRFQPAVYAFNDIIIPKKMKKVNEIEKELQFFKILHISQEMKVS